MRNLKKEEIKVIDGQHLIRDWSYRKRLAWWVRFMAAVAAGIVACAGAAKILGFQWDVQTKTEAQAQYDALRRDIANDQKQSINKLENKIDKLGDRIDSISNILINNNRRRQ
jgi:hypothetical protein